MSVRPVAPDTPEYHDMYDEVSTDIANSVHEALDRGLTTEEITLIVLDTFRAIEDQYDPL